MQPAPTPAIKHGQPRVMFRWWRSFALTMLALTVPGVVPLFINWQQGVATRVLLAIAMIIQIGAWLYLFQLLYRSFAIFRAIKQQPPACLNCLHPLVLNQRICPECGHLQNRLDLSRGWQDWLVKQRRKSASR